MERLIARRLQRKKTTAAKNIMMCPYSSYGVIQVSERYISPVWPKNSDVNTVF